MQQLILVTGTAIWWLTEPHCDLAFGQFKVPTERLYFTRHSRLI